MTNPITLDDFAQAIAKYRNDERLNPQHPGNANSAVGCSYNVPLPTGVVEHCIAGQALADLGVTVPDELEGDSMVGVVGRYSIRDNFAVEDRLAIGVLGAAVQLSADTGSPWGEAIQGGSERLAVIANGGSDTLMLSDAQRAEVPRAKAALERALSEVA